MTDCYATKRRNALDELGDYDSSCHPEIINAFVYGLNDTDERVRREAADELGDAARSNSCSCSSGRCCSCSRSCSCSGSSS
jgi:hypothetical protein